MDRSDFEKIKNEAKLSGEKVWLAGLGALGKVSAEGKKAFERLVEEGREIQKELEPKAEKLADNAKAAAKEALEEGRRFEKRIAEAVSEMAEKMALAKDARVSELERRLEKAEEEIRQLRAAADNSAVPSRVEETDPLAPASPEEANKN